MSRTGIGIWMIDHTYLSDHSTKSQYNGILYRFSNIITEFVPLSSHKTQTENKENRKLTKTENQKNEN